MTYKKKKQAQKKKQELEEDFFYKSLIKEMNDINNMIKNLQKNKIIKNFR